MELPSHLFLTSEFVVDFTVLRLDEIAVAQEANEARKEHNKGDKAVVRDPPSLLQVLALVQPLPNLAYECDKPDANDGLQYDSSGFLNANKVNNARIARQVLILDMTPRSLQSNGYFHPCRAVLDTSKYLSLIKQVVTVYGNIEYVRGDCRGSRVWTQSILGVDAGGQSAREERISGVQGSNFTGGVELERALQQSGGLDFSLHRFFYSPRGD